MKKLISLSLMLSLGLATITPTLNAAQAQQGSPAPAWTKTSGFEAAKKWWRAGRNMNALSPQEQKAFNALKAKVGITAIIAILTAIAATIGYQKREAIATKAADITNKINSQLQKMAVNARDNLDKAAANLLLYMRKSRDRAAHAMLKKIVTELSEEEKNNIVPTAVRILTNLHPDATPQDYENYKKEVPELDAFLKLALETKP